MQFSHCPSIIFQFLHVIVCTFHFISIQVFIRMLHSVPGMCFHLFLVLLCIFFQSYDFTPICALLPPLPFFHFFLDYFPFSFHASRSFNFTPIFPLHYPFTTRKRARSHTSPSSTSPRPPTDACIRLNLYIRYGATVPPPTTLVVIHLPGFPALKSERG